MCVKARTHENKHETKWTPHMSVVWSCAAHAAGACKEEWHCAQPCPPIPLPGQCQSTLPGFLFGMWITSLCGSIFITIPKRCRKPFPLGCQWDAQRLFRGWFKQLKTIWSVLHQTLAISCLAAVIPTESPRPACSHQPLQHHSLNLPFIPLAPSPAQSSHSP